MLSISSPHEPSLHSTPAVSTLMLIVCLTLASTEENRSAPLSSTTPDYHWLPRQRERVSRQGEDGSWDLLSTTHHTHLFDHGQPESSGETWCEEIQLIPSSLKDTVWKTIDAVGSLHLPIDQWRRGRSRRWIVHGLVQWLHHGERKRKRRRDIHTNRYERKRSEGKEKQTNRAYLPGRRSMVKWNFPLNDTGIYTVVGSTRREREISNADLSLAHWSIAVWPIRKSILTREERDKKPRVISLPWTLLGPCLVDDRRPRIFTGTSPIFLVSGRSHRRMPSHVKVDPLKSSHWDAERERKRSSHSSDSAIFDGQSFSQWSSCEIRLGIEMVLHREAM